MNDAFETLDSACNVLRNTYQHEHLSDLEPTELLSLALACMASRWDVVPSDLSIAQIKAILENPRNVRPTFDGNGAPVGVEEIK